MKTWGEITVQVKELKNGVRHWREYRFVFKGNKLVLHSYDWHVDTRYDEYQNYPTRMVLLSNGYCTWLDKKSIERNKDVFKRIRWSHLRKLDDLRVPKEVLQAAYARLKKIKQ